MNISPVSFTGIVNKWQSHDDDWCRTYYPFKDEKLSNFKRDDDTLSNSTNSEISRLVDNAIGHDKDCQLSWLGEPLPFYSYEFKDCKIINKRKDRSPIYSLWYKV